jgi:ADP-heptose:LPS heptosyltransferase
VSAGAGDVLALRALGLGDALTGIAALRGARRAWPDRRLVLAAPRPLGDWLRRLGVVDEVLPTSGLAPLPAVPRPYVALNLHGRGPQSHALLLATHPWSLVAFRCPQAGHGSGPVWRRDEHEVLRWCRLLASAEGRCGPEDLRLPAAQPRGEQVIVHPGAASPARRWPEGRWRQLVTALGAGGRRIEVTGTAAEAELCYRVADASPVASAAVDLSLEELADRVAAAALLVSGDTGVAHLATAYATPSVTLFGPTPPTWWGPLLDPRLHTGIWHGRENEVGDPHADAVDPRLARVEVAEVLAAADALLAR